MRKVSVYLSTLVAGFVITGCGGSNNNSNNSGNGVSADPVNFEFTALGAKDPEHLTEAGGVLYFQAAVNDHYEEIWTSDGTLAGTKPVTDIQRSHIIAPDELVHYDGELYFNYGLSVASSGDLVVLDAAEPSGARRIGETASLDPEHFAEFGGKLYFSGNAQEGGRELWVTDGTDAGTQQVKNINQQINEWGSYGASRPSGFTEVDGLLYFSADDGKHGRELWVTDGTETGTRMVKNINPDGSSVPSEITALGDKLVFRAHDGEHGYEPWVSDGTEAGTKLLKRIHVEEVDGHPDPGSWPTGFIEFNGQLYFVAATNGFTNGSELWVTDGTEAGTERLSEIRPRFGNGRVIYDGKLYFAASDGEHGTQLWRTDGTAGGTELAVILDESAESHQLGGNPRELTVFDGHLVFTADDGLGEDDNERLWVSNGTEAGTRVIEPADATQEDPLNRSFIDFTMKVHDGALYFPANFTVDGRQLWRLQRVN